MYVCMYVCMRASVRVRVRVNVCVCVCVLVCLWCARVRGALVLVVFSCCVRDVIFTVEVVHCIILFEYVTHNT